MYATPVIPPGTEVVVMANADGAAFTVRRSDFESDKFDESVTFAVKS